jgi:hypothetical protein
MSLFSRATLNLAVVALLMSVTGSCYAYERTLAGLQLGRPASTVLKKYGNPTSIRVGTVALTATVQTPFGMADGGPGANPFAGANPYARAMQGLANEAGLGPMNPLAPNYAAPPLEGGLPPLPGIGGPPGTSAPMMTGQQTAAITQQEVTWTYDLAGGVTLEVIVAEGGIITQVTVGGAAQWKSSRTSKGIQLNSTYKDVIYRYGYPEAHTQAGRFLRMSYVDRDRCMFTLLNKRVVGVTIALAD